MPKQFLEDMVKSKRLKEGIKKVPKSIEVKQIVDTMEMENSYNPKKSRNFLWIIALVSVLFCFFAISFLFSKAQVVVNPKTQDITVNENLSADKDSDVNGM